MCFTAWMALPAEDHLSEFVAKALDLLRIGCGSEMLCKFKERVLLFRLDAFFGKFAHPLADNRLAPPD